MITLSSPARIDLAGGWTDTPPITWDVPSCVVNMAVRVDGVLPITVSISKIDDPCIRVITDNGVPYTLTSYEGFDNPEREGALVKCALKLTEIPIDAGLEITTQSSLPHGSGLGTSSILAATLLKALYVLKGEEVSKNTLVMNVLKLEELLTTCGGWQDQVGSVYPGIKITHGNGDRNLILNTEQLECSDLEQHLCLIFTGKTRLAKNLLQTVVDGWRSRDTFIIDTVVDLMKGAVEMGRAVETSNIPKIGRLLSEYWEQKKRMAAASEPPHVTEMFEAIDSLVWGRSLCGAGGGGFAVLVTKAPVEEILPYLEEILSDFPGCTIHRIQAAR